MPTPSRLMATFFSTAAVGAVLAPAPPGSSGVVVVVVVAVVAVATAAVVVVGAVLLPVGARASCRCLWSSHHFSKAVPRQNNKISFMQHNSERLDKMFQKINVRSLRFGFARSKMVSYL